MAKRLSVETFTHGEASRKNIPTAEFESVLDPADQDSIRAVYKRRNRDLDPQLVWRGKDLQNWSDLVVQAPPLFIQEKVHPKVLVDDLQRETRKRRTGAERGNGQPDLFVDFTGTRESRITGRQRRPSQWRCERVEPDGPGRQPAR